MSLCGVNEHLVIERGGMSDYARLADYHYCGAGLNGYSDLFVLRDTRSFGACRPAGGVAGVIVYTMPVANVRGRNIATGGYFSGFGDRAMQLELINKNIRCIRRVIIEPRYRGIGLAAKLVRETMELVDVPVIEALAVMGNFNPFFARAGMKAIRQPRDVKCAVLIEVLASVGICEDMFVDPAGVHRRIESLADNDRRFVRSRISKFIKAYGKRGGMKHSPERTRYVIGKLGFQPMYYIKIKEKMLNQNRRGNATVCCLNSNEETIA